MFETLDYRTMLFMSGLVAVALSALLLTIYARLATFHGLGITYWVSANLLIGLSIIIFIVDIVPLNIRALIGGLCIVVGLALYFVAIKAFEQFQLAPVIVKKILAVFILINTAVTIFSRNEYASILLNTLLCVVISIVTALFLLKKRDSQKKLIEHQFTALFFVIFACLTFYRLLVFSSNQINPLQHLSQWGQNETTFLACMLSILAINFGFIAMVNVRVSEQLAHTAGHDWLTGVMNRGRLEQMAEVIKTNSIRYGQTQAMLLMDLDGFKTINDTYGHLFGDKVIKAFAALVSDSIRGVDALGRYGGEEFCIIMPNTNEAAAYVLAERIRQKYATTPIFVDNIELTFTVSIGVSDSSQVGNDFKDMFEAADKALYSAKNAGKNKTVAHSVALKNKVMKPWLAD